MQEAQRGNEQRWEQVRACYPAQEPLLNLNNAAVSPPPRAVEQAAIEALRLVSRNPDVNMWTRLDANLPSIKDALAALVDCDPAEIALNRNSTEGLSTVIFGVTLQAGDEVVVSEWDYPSALGGWRQRAAREGIRVVTARFDPLADDDAIVSAYSNALTPRTRVMQLTHMLHWTGRVLPAERLCGLARESGVVSLVDGAQTFAQMPVSFRTLGCDFFVTSLHKWLGAPVGNGMLIARRDRIASTWPLMAPFEDAPDRIDKFDHWNLGTYNSALQAGIAPAIEMHRETGVHAMHARLRELTRYWVGLASGIRGFRLHTPVDDERLAAVSLFSIAGVDMRHVERELRERHQVHVKYRRIGPIEGLRVSPHVYTRKSELQRFVEALDRVLG
ncbi:MULTISPECIES: aminotransferase class V-fold PLP-dependent enzyme [unclassified Variovorax]|uniref:aminotransferase class V-fold PLP-dependent enzyme n=1 Tax=unclassified Variovorax TaxID=663243 RepID=UPI003ED0D08B